MTICIFQENEYCFIASKNKDAMSYYGNGTEISLTSQSDTNSAFFDETICSRRKIVGTFGTRFAR